ncbi:MAG: phosphate ABC transporter permease subunit PstC [Eubacteriales bacterium]|nr:phosphate ABC transporter permease subunit PstC [Eubacteriales bacterium]
MKFSEKLVEKIIFACAAVSAASVALITIFIFGRGLPILAKVGPVAFITGGNWSPGNEVYGILPLIAGSISVTLGALIIGVPLGISCAVFLAEVLGKRQAKFFQSAIELLAGIPSVVYGFFGLIILVPALRKLTHAIHADSGATGFSILAGAIILAIMILPTIVSMSTNAINAVPLKYREASLAMGADKRETITKVILPAAKSGIFSSAVLGMGRAIGETMAVMMVTGNVASLPTGIMSPVATMTGTIAMEMSYATPTHQQALFAIGIVLFIIIMILNGSAQLIMKKLGGGTESA